MSTRLLSIERPKLGPVMKVKLIIVSPEVSPNEYEITLPTKIGRGLEAKLKLVHPLVSRLHCELFSEGEQVMIRDLDSLNGTFVDQQRIDEDTAIPSGATVIIGTVMFRVAYGKDAERLPPPSAAKMEKTAATAGTIRTDTVQDASVGNGGAVQQSAAAGHSDDDEFSVAPLDEEPASDRPTEKAANGKAPQSASTGDDDDLDDFLQSIM
jgi:pSer/pThr/pTyr-binding forkhead associated (FHA) protein